MKYKGTCLVEISNIEKNLKFKNIDSEIKKIEGLKVKSYMLNH